MIERDQVNELTEDEAKKIRKYLKEANKLQSEMPKSYTVDDLNNPDFLVQFNDWEDQWTALSEKYSDLLEKAFQIGVDKLTKSEHGATSLDIIKYALPETEREPSHVPQLATDLLNDDYVVLYTTSLTNFVYSQPISKKDFTVSVEIDNSKTATFENDEVEITISHYEELEGDLGTTALKLWDIATAYLSLNNIHRSNPPYRLTVEIPLTEYAKTRKIDVVPRTMKTKEAQRRENKRVADNRRCFIDDLYKDLNNLKLFNIRSKVKTGNHRYKFYEYVSSYDIGNDVISITFDERTADYIIHGQAMQYSPALQGLDDRNPNLYRVGRKLLQQASNYKAAFAGTNNTLKVKTILACTNLPTPEKLKQEGQRNWKEKIKNKLEKIFQKLIDEEILIRWEYRDPRPGGETYNARTASTLTPDEYINLDVDFVLKENPQFIENLQQKEKQKQNSISADKPEKKPKKQGKSKKNTA